MWRKYLNEIIVAVALLVALGAFAFQYSSLASLQAASIETRTTTAMIRDTATLKALWGNTRKIHSQMVSLRESLNSGKIKEFVIKKQSAQIALVDLEGGELNRLVGKLLSLPIQIQSVAVKRQEKNYRLELQCRW